MSQPNIADHEAGIAQSLIETQRIANAGDLSLAQRERARKVNLRLQLADLRRHNPEAARRWVEQRVGG